MSLFFFLKSCNHVAGKSEVYYMYLHVMTQCFSTKNNESSESFQGSQAVICSSCVHRFLHVCEVWIILEG